jgi:hypothetical protein
MMDVCVDGELVSAVALEVGGEPATLTAGGWAPGDHLFELWLPYFSQVVIGEILLEEGATVQRDDREYPRWTHFGSSISQGRGAAPPSRAWAVLTAQAARLELTLTAMGGGCQIQPMFARLNPRPPGGPHHILPRHQPLSLQQLNGETYQPNLVGFVRLIR